jgi:hypothetical protein
LDLRDPSAEMTFASTSIRQHVDSLPRSIMVHPTIPAGLHKNRWNLPSAIARNLSVVFEFFLPSCSDMSRNATNGCKYRSIPRRIPMLQVSRLAAETLSYLQA